MEHRFIILNPMLIKNGEKAWRSSISIMFFTSKRLDIINCILLLSGFTLFFAVQNIATFFVLLEVITFISSFKHLFIYRFNDVNKVSLFPSTYGNFNQMIFPLPSSLFALFICWLVFKSLTNELQTWQG